MSVSMSSVYEQTESLKQIDELLLQAETNFNRVRDEIVSLSKNLSISESYRLIAMLAKTLISPSSIMPKIVCLQVLKSLLLTSYHNYYIFSSAKILPILSVLYNFEIKKKQAERVRLYLKQINTNGNGDEFVQERNCFKFLQLVEEFVDWFAEHLPYHINAEFSFRSTFIRVCEEYPKRNARQNYEMFGREDFASFEDNFHKSKNANMYNIRELGEFLGLEVRSLLKERKEKSEMLRGIVRTADSYCVRAIVGELSFQLEENNNLTCCLKLIHELMMVGEIEFIELVKLHVIPILFSKLFPFNIESIPTNEILSEKEKVLIIRLLVLWDKITDRVGLSKDLYTCFLDKLKKQGMKVDELNVDKELGTFFTNIIEIDGVNMDKKENVRLGDKEKEIIQMFDGARGSFDSRWSAGFRESKGMRGSMGSGGKDMRVSAINELNEFGDGGRADEKFDSGGFEVAAYGFRNSFKPLNSVNSPKNSNANRLKGYPEIITFKDTEKPPESVNEANSSFKGSLKIENNGKGEKAEKSSFMAFEASNLSSFSEYSVKKSKESFKKIEQDHEAYHSIPFVKSNQSNLKSESGEVVYFGNIEYSSSSGSQVNKETKNKGNESHFSMSSARSLKEGTNNHSSQMSTYRFDASSFSNSSANSSDIHNFGKDVDKIPDPIPKQKFGFHKRFEYQEAVENQNENFGDQENILGIEHDPRKMSNPNILRLENPSKFRESLKESEIEDLSGGKHMINDSVKLSDRSSVSSKRSNKSVKKKESVFKKTDPKYLKINPYTEYYEEYPDNSKENLFLQSKNNKFLLKANELSPEENKKGRVGSGKRLSDNEYQLKITGNIKDVKSDKNLLGSSRSSKGLKNSREFDKGTRIDKSLRKKHIIIDEFGNDKLLSLEKELGKAMNEKNMKYEALKRKEEEYKLLKSKSVPFMGRKLENLKKENEIINILVAQKNKEDYGINVDIVRPIKNQNKMSDYFLENEVKDKISSLPQPFSRIFVKQILGSRCLLLATDELELGYNYSQRQNEISLYLTFFKVFEAANVKINQNSLILDKEVNMTMENQPSGVQLKIKRKVMGVVNIKKKEPSFSQVISHNSSTEFIFPEIKIQMQDEFGSYQTLNTNIPCSMFNLAQPIDINMETVDYLKGREVIRSEAVPIGQEFTKNYREKIDKYFPSHMALVDGWSLIGFKLLKEIFGDETVEFFKFRVVNGKEIEIEFFNDPRSLLAETMMCLLIGKQK